MGICRFLRLLVVTEHFTVEAMFLQPVCRPTSVGLSYEVLGGTIQSIVEPASNGYIVFWLYVH